MSEIRRWTIWVKAGLHARDAAATGPTTAAGVEVIEAAPVIEHLQRALDEQKINGEDWSILTADIRALLTQLRGEAA